MGFRRSAAPALFVFSIAVLAGCNSSSEPEATSSSVADTTLIEAEAEAGPTDPVDGGLSGLQPSPGEPNPGPTPVDPAAVVAFAEAANAEVVLARLEDGRPVLWHDGRFVEVASTSYGSVWSDGDFVYYWAGEGGRTLSSVAQTLDGTVVCEADGPIHHATRRADGGFVMAVQLDDKLQEWDGIGEYGVPLEAVDCQTGDRQPIESVLIFGGDGGTRFIERLAGRVFRGYGDAEGNADLLNERGVSINGEDYAGYHTFNGDASTVIYGDMGAGTGPHFSPVVVARDTDSGQELWRSEFDVPFSHLDFIGDRVAVGFIDDEERRVSYGGPEDRLVLLDASNGIQLAEVEVGFDLLYVG